MTYIHTALIQYITYEERILPLPLRNQIKWYLMVQLNEHLTYCGLGHSLGPGTESCIRLTASKDICFRILSLLPLPRP